MQTWRLLDTPPITVAENMAMDETLLELKGKGKSLSWQNFGRRITFYLPGMFRVDGMTGKYPALSITGSRCALQCGHPMPAMDHYRRV